MKIRFLLNGIEFECEFNEIADMLQFIRNLTQNNHGRVKILSFVIKEVVYIF